jgi:cbb3-type cytochrome c oxidase subunit III
LLSLALAGAFALGACGTDAEDGMDDDAMDEVPAETMDEPEPADVGGGAPVVDAANLPEGVTQAMIDAGQQVFANAGFCYTCHGQDGMGSQIAPNLTDDTWVHAENGDYEQIVTVVTKGVPEPVDFTGPMPAMGGAQLTEAQVREVAAYVWALSHGG